MVCKVKPFGCVNFCPHWTCRIRTTIQRHFGLKFLPLSSPYKVQIINYEKKMFDLFSGSSSFAVRMLSSTDLPICMTSRKVMNEAKYFTFWPLTMGFDITAWCQILKKNSNTGLFPSQVGCANICPHWTSRIRTTTDLPNWLFSLEGDFTKNAEFAWRFWCRVGRFSPLILIRSHFKKMHKISGQFLFPHMFFIETVSDLCSIILSYINHFRNNIWYTCSTKMLILGRFLS